MRTKLLRLFRKREEIPDALKCPTCKGKGKTAHGSIDGWVVLLCRDCKGTGRRAESYNAGKQSASVSWLDVLAVRWERRIVFLENGCNCGPQSYHQGLIDAHGDCLKDLRAEMESASIASNSATDGRSERKRLTCWKTMNATA